MKGKHWLGLAVLLLIGYAAGVFFPGPGQKLKGMVGGGAAA